MSTTTDTADAQSSKRQRTKDDNSTEAVQMDKEEDAKKVVLSGEAQSMLQHVAVIDEVVKALDRAKDKGNIEPRTAELSLRALERALAARWEPKISMTMHTAAKKPEFNGGTFSIVGE